MASRSLVILLCLLAGCGRVDDEPNAAAMDAIEAQIELPPGSEPISRYSRYYALGDRGKIEALYIIHDQYAFSDTAQFCANESFRTFPCSADGEAALAPAGSRKWLNNKQDLPMMHGGGCGVIRFSYDASSHEYSAFQCNAEY